jgi:exonuclease III
MRRILCVLVCTIAFTHHAIAEDTVRVASYNIFFLTDEISDERAERVRQVIAELDADVIGLQEIKDRSALELIFDPNEWLLVIDDESGDDQDVALAVRKPLELPDGPADLDADDEHFLFAGSQHNVPYPNRRDALCIKVKTPGGATCSVVVHHWKSRKGGRAATDERREEAAHLMALKMGELFDGENVIVLGDFNDNYDDRSLNILETGDPDMVGGPESIDGPLMINLMEPLGAKNCVTHGVLPTPLTDDGRLNIVKPNSRNRNNEMRGQDGHSGAILFDQILIPMHMAGSHVDNSTTIFDGPVAREGENPAEGAASDHLPVYADFVLGPDEETDEPVPSPEAASVVIVSLLPDPVGEDHGNEWVELRNDTGESVNLDGWHLRDRAGNILPLSGEIAPGEEKTIADEEAVMPLNNSGDEVQIVRGDGVVVHRFDYNANEVAPGGVIAE